MKAIKTITYKCPKCKVLHTNEEWTSDDNSKTYKCLCDDCFAKKSNNFPAVINKPPWLIKPDLHKLATDGELNHKYTEAVIGESRKWTSSGKWASYEKSRKDYIKSQKAEWIEKGATPQDRDAIMNG